MRRKRIQESSGSVKTSASGNACATASFPERMGIVSIGQRMFSVGSFQIIARSFSGE